MKIKNMLKFLLPKTTKRKLIYIYNFIVNGYRRILHRIKHGTPAQVWTLGIRRHGEKKYKFIKPPKGRIYADPFLIEDDGKHYVFFEDCETGKMEGIISVAQVNEDCTLSAVRTVLSRDYHLSFPCVFKYDDDFFMIPETAQNRTIELYRAVSFPDIWEIHCIINEDIHALDNVLYHNDEGFWLFSNVVSKGNVSGVELNIFYSDSLNGPWYGHPKNPVLCDIKSARPAGKVFREGGRLLRPGQDCERCYGYAVTLKEITHLSREDYSEKNYRTILPEEVSPKAFCTHTLNKNSQFEIVDILKK
ncbi:conserved hypothetical protein [Candidatus Terasakiella magnetica]|uniref:Glucosamine inositolphosphorylceramide transferase 1 N-terminal domain-containing protein n=1 Tax=Candidatus Terasakiella magnetica TaxID=1867952 RepID=A0A1C3RFX2_9PROT|nr:hypothetical protein [Candidatus Terasakiella magnetica]SCA56193.1 conserved hypothetical protein [Candidatus Terasakiella magnetica]